MKSRLDFSFSSFDLPRPSLLSLVSVVLKCSGSGSGLPARTVRRLECSATPLTDLIPINDRRMVRALAAIGVYLELKSGHVRAFPINRSMESTAFRAGQHIARAIGY